MLKTRTPLSLDGQDFETTAEKFQSKLANSFCLENPVIVGENVSSLLVLMMKEGSLKEKELTQILILSLLRMKARRIVRLKMSICHSAFDVY